MLSYNKKNIDNLFEEIVNRIDRNLEKSIYIKQENQKCAQVSQEESNEMAKSDTEVRVESTRRSVHYQRVKHLIIGGIKSTFSHVYKRNNVTKTLNNDIDKPFRPDTKAKEWFNRISNFRSHLGNFAGKEITKIATVLPRVKISMTEAFTAGFGTIAKHFEINNDNGSMSWLDGKGAFNHISGVIATIQAYRKRITAINDHDMSEGELKAYNKWKSYLHGRGGDMKDEHWEKFFRDRANGETDIDFYDVYKFTEDGKRILKAEDQAPKSGIVSVHNLNNKVILSANAVMREIGEDGIPLIAKIYNSTEVIRKTAIEKLRNKIYEMHKLVSTGTAKLGEKFDSKFDALLHVLERGERPRVVNNLMYILKHGEVESTKFFRFVTDAVRVGSYEDELGNVTSFSGNGKNGRSFTPDGLDINIARQNAIIEVLSKNNGKAPTMHEIAEGFGLTGRSLRVDGIEISTTKQATAFIDNVDVDAFDAFSRAMITASYASGEIDKRTKENAPTVDFFINEFNLRDENGKIRIQKSIIEDEEIRSKIKKMLETNIGAVDPDRKFDWENSDDNYLVTSIINNYIMKIRNAQTHIDASKNINSSRNGSFDAGDPIDGEGRVEFREAQNAVLLKLRKGLVTQRSDSPEQKAQIKWDRLFRKHLKQAKGSMNADRSWSTQELEGEGGDGTLKGYYNRSMDIWSALQTYKGLNGLGSFWGFQDHHIYGKGDNQANTHFQQMMVNFHQNGVHLTNFLPEGLQTNMLNLEMMQKVYKLYLENDVQNNPAYEDYQFPDEILVLMQKYFDVNGNHRNPEMVKYLKEANIEEIHRKIVSGEIDSIYHDQYVPIFDYDKPNPNYNPLDPGEPRFKLKGYTLKKEGVQPAITMIAEHKGNSETSKANDIAWELETLHGNFSTPPQQQYMFAEGVWNKNNITGSGKDKRHLGGWSILNEEGYHETSRPFIDETTEKINWDTFRFEGHVPS